MAEGCGNTFRPTIVPLPGASGDPASLSQAVVLATNPAGPGSVTHINASGDTNAGVIRVGINPVYIAKIGTSQAMVINSDQTLSLYLALLPISATVNTITQPPGSANGISAAASSNGNIYVANSGSNSVTVVPGATNVAIGNVSVGSNPVAVATNSASNKAYIVNQAGNSVTVINTQDSTPGTTVPVGTSPIFAIPGADGQLVFVVNQGSNSVTVIDSLTDLVVPIAPALTTGASPNFAFYDAKLKRLYVNNSGANSITVIKADQYDPTHNIFPSLLGTITLSPGPLPTSLTVLADGTKAYVARGGCTAGTNQVTLLANLGTCTGNLVSVIDTIGLREVRTITVEPGAVSVASSSDGTRVFVVNAGANSASIIKTGTDSVLTRIAMPQQNPLCDPTLGACALQIPFMVRTFP